MDKKILCCENFPLDANQLRFKDEKRGNRYSIAAVQESGVLISNGVFDDPETGEVLLTGVFYSYADLIANDVCYYGEHGWVPFRLNFILPMPR